MFSMQSAKKQTMSGVHFWSTYLESCDFRMSKSNLFKYSFITSLMILLLFVSQRAVLFFESFYLSPEHTGMFSDLGN